MTYSPTTLAALEMNLNITAIRRAGHGDRAIVDLLQLRQLNLIPGVVSRDEIEVLWGVTQPNVSRRMQAVGPLGIVTVRPTHRAGYTVCDQPPVVAIKPRRPVDTEALRICWEAMRRRWRQEVGP